MVKQARCGDKWADTADALSKGDEGRVRKLMGGKLEKRKRKIPRELANWIQQPIPDPELGLRIAREISNKMKLLEWATPRMTRRMRMDSNKMLGASKEEKKRRGKKRKR
jgi:hypothetical protein